MIDFGDKGGYGICYEHATASDINHGIWRAVELYHDKEKMSSIIRHMMKLDFSWEKSVAAYEEVYESVKR